MITVCDVSEGRRTQAFRIFCRLGVSATVKILNEGKMAANPTRGTGMEHKLDCREPMKSIRNQTVK